MTASVLLQAIFLVPALGGASMMLVAGRGQARGRIRFARRLGRRAGFVVAAGAAAGSFAILWGLGTARSPSLLFAGAAAILVAGAAGLLGGLSGKPRPAGPFAIVLVVLGWIAAVAAQ